MTSRQLLFALLGVFAIIQLVFSMDFPQEGFISLDCGLSANEPPYTDSYTALNYSSDAKFVEGGKSGTIQKHLEANITKAYTTLRYFPDGIRNCYNLNVTQDTRYLVRASFVYGNYDGLDSHPTFDLYIGRTWWATISKRLEDHPDNKWASLQSPDTGYGKSEEIVHTTWSNTLQVCLLKTDETVPFISALELRPLSNNVYATRKGRSLKTIFRVYLSNIADTRRYPDDIHDRLWSSHTSKDLTILNNNTLVIKNYNPYDQPVAAISTAAIPTNASSHVIISWVTSNSTDQFYVYIHFLELQDLRANETRIFEIVVNGNITSEAYRPSKSMVDTVYNKVPLNCNDSKCSLELRKTPASTLPPLINAVEVYTVHEISESATYADDVNAFEKILAAYALSNGGGGDPCVPKPSHYLKCSNNTDTSVPLRIISLNLSSIGLSGVISPTIQNLTKLQILDLSSNNLTGGVPIFLSNMASLLFIDLCNNSLQVKEALLDRKKEGLVLNHQGNPNLFEIQITSPKKNFPLVVVASSCFHRHCPGCASFPFHYLTKKAAK